VSGTVAIIGSGPSGFFVADMLLKSDIRPTVHMFDRLPTPFGLVRSGVAPDHPSIKSVSRVFDQIAGLEGFSFFGNVEIGKDIPLDTLRRHYSAVVLAYGASVDNDVDVPGRHLDGVISAGKFVGWYNGHPDFADFKPNLNVQDVVIIGHGNVALDVARILLTNPASLARTDIADHALEALLTSHVRSVHLVGRRGPLQASFTTAEIRELLLKTDGVRLQFEEGALSLSDEETAELENPANVVIKRNVEIMREAAARGSDKCFRILKISFLESLDAVLGSSRIEQVILKKNVLASTNGVIRAVPTMVQRRISAGMLVTSVGFSGRPLCGTPFDGRLGRIPNIKGRVLPRGPQTAPLYVAGWIKRGANGVIGSNKMDAAETATAMIEDFQRNEWLTTELCGSVDFSLPRYVTFEDWRIIDAAEIEAGRPQSRPRRKIVSIPKMLEMLPAGGRQ
jgi:ferredoxin/flavodoxin---NADP+ reductase